MNNVDQLVQKQRQYVDAYNRICGICNLLAQEVKMLNAVVGASARCYQYNDTNVGGVYITNVQNRLINRYNYIVNTILPQIRTIINQYQEAIVSQSLTQ